MEEMFSTITTPEEDVEVIYHIRGKELLTACGLNDVPHEVHWAHEHRPTCPACIGVVRYYKNLKTVG